MIQQPVLGASKKLRGTATFKRHNFDGEPCWMS